MVGACPSSYYHIEFFEDKNWTPEEASDAYNAKNVVRFNILQYLNRWNQIPVDSYIVSKTAARLKNATLTPITRMAIKFSILREGLGQSRRQS